MTSFCLRVDTFLDLMASYESHLSNKVGRVTGLGLNEAELEHNRRPKRLCRLRPQPLGKSALPRQPLSTARSAP